jgi:hypothetical protein
MARYGHGFPDVGQTLAEAVAEFEIGAHGFPKDDQEFTDRLNNRTQPDTHDDTGPPVIIEGPR